MCCQAPTRQECRTVFEALSGVRQRIAEDRNPETPFDLREASPEPVLLYCACSAPALRSTCLCDSRPPTNRLRTRSQQGRSAAEDILSRIPRSPPSTVRLTPMAFSVPIVVASAGRWYERCDRHGNSTLAGASGFVELPPLGVPKATLDAPCSTPRATLASRCCPTNNCSATAVIGWMRGYCSDTGWLVTRETGPSPDSCIARTAAPSAPIELRDAACGGHASPALPR